MWARLDEQKVNSREAKEWEGSGGKRGEPLRVGTERGPPLSIASTLSFSFHAPITPERERHSGGGEGNTGRSKRKWAPIFPAHSALAW